MSKFIEICLALCILCIAYTCQNSKVDIAVGVCFDDLSDEQSFNFAESLKRRIAELGGETVIRTARGKHLTQVKQAKALVNSGIRVLVIRVVDHDKGSEIVDYAKAHGVIVIAYDKLITNCQLDYIVTYNYRGIGQIQAKAVVDAMPRGNYALLGGPRGSRNAKAMRSGQLSTLKRQIKSRRVKIILDTIAATADREAGYQITRDMLAGPGNHADAILAANDEVASGVVQALQEAIGPDGLSLAGKVLVAGVDAESLALRRIDRGLQGFTIHKPVKLCSFTVAKVAYLLATNQKIKGTVSFLYNGKKKVPTTFIPAIIVSKMNMQVVDND